MEFDQIRDFFLSHEGTIEEFPFGDDVAIYKVSGIKFGIISKDNHTINVKIKCEAKQALELRKLNRCIVPCCQLDEAHWSTLIVDGRLPDDMLKALITHSYDFTLNTEVSCILLEA